MSNDRTVFNNANVVRLVDFRGSYYKIKRNDPAYFTVSISRNMSRFVVSSFFFHKTKGFFLFRFTLFLEVKVFIHSRVSKSKLLSPEAVSNFGYEA